MPENTNAQTLSIMTRLHNLLGGILGMAEGMTSNIPALAGSIGHIKQLQADHASIGQLISEAAPAVEEIVTEVEDAANPAPPAPAA